MWSPSIKDRINTKFLVIPILLKIQEDSRQDWTIQSRGKLPNLQYTPTETPAQTQNNARLSTTQPQWNKSQKDRVRIWQVHGTKGLTRTTTIIIRKTTTIAITMAKQMHFRTAILNGKGHRITPVLACLAGQAASWPTLSNPKCKHRTSTTSWPTRDNLYQSHPSRFPASPTIKK